MQSCAITKILWDTEAFIHLSTCRPCCSDCYFVEICRRTDRFNHAKSCWLRRWLSIKNDHGWRYELSYARKICQICDKMSSPAQKSWRETRDRAEMDRLAHQAIVCSRCKNSLPDKRPKWWVCSKCSSECRHHVHPARAEKLEVWAHHVWVKQELLCQPYSRNLETIDHDDVNNPPEFWCTKFMKKCYYWSSHSHWRENRS